MRFCATPTGKSASERGHAPCAAALRGWQRPCKLAALAASVMLWAALASGCSNQDGTPTETVTIRGVTFTVELAATRGTRTNGLMYRTHLPDRHGMLFIFADDRPRRFWMKNTFIPLDIAFIRRDGSIARIHTMKPLDTVSPYDSGEPVRYALEVNAGTFARYGIEPGQRVDLPPAILKIRAEPDD